MNNVIDLTYSRRTELPCISDREAQKFLRKGWTLPSTYYFSEIRDIYLALSLTKFQNISAFTDFCNEIKLPFVRSPWEKRRILEHLNALVNFSLIGPDYSISKRVFQTSRIGGKISEEDKAVFRDIYFDYFRFKEVFSWFLDLNPKSRLALVESLSRDDIVDRSRPLFALSQSGRFHDTFFCELNDKADTYYLGYSANAAAEEDGNGGLLRFWDLFIKWGTELQVLEKFSLRDVGIRTSSNKNIVCSYVVQDYPAEFSLLAFISSSLGNARYIYLPYLVFQIARTYRLSIEKTHNLIVMEYRSHTKDISFERTSEIFIRGSDIKDRDKILFLKYNDSYISHLVIRK